MIGKLAENIVNKIITDISDRNGIGDEWNTIDIEIQKEIISEWKNIIIEEISDML